MSSPVFDPLLGEMVLHEHAASATPPGGSDTQFQYNNAGAFGGTAKLVFDGTYIKFPSLPTSDPFVEGAAWNSGGTLKISNGAPPPFDPSSISGLKLWLKADAITGLSDGDAITTWSDSSGEGDDATQSTAGQKPIYKTAIQNGLAVVRFDGSNDVMAATLGADIAQPITAYIVAKLTTASGQRRLLDSTNRMLFDVNFGAAAGSQYSFYINGASGSDNTDGTANTNIHLFTAIWNGASSNFWVDTVLATTSYNMGTSTCGTTIYVGATNAAGNQSMAGDYHELLIYSGAHDSTQRGNVQTYLNNKWAVY